MRRTAFFRGTVANRLSAIARAIPLATVVVVVGCAGGGPEPVAESALPMIVDNARGGGSGIYFLPPMVPKKPALHGAFAADLSPVVRIDELSGPDGDVLRTLATYTMTSGHGHRSEGVRVTDSHYVVNWHTDRYRLDSRHVYRIHVLLDERSLAFADVQLVGRRCRVKHVDTEEYVPLINGRTLPIKFWLNRCAPVVCSAADQCHDGGTCDADTGQCTSPPAPDGTTCDDGNLCTWSDTCQAGACAGTEVVCPGNPSSQSPSVCDPGTGLCSVTEDPPICGNRVVEQDEQCDDGDTTGGDGCSAECENEFCGDGSALRTIARLRFVFLGRSCNRGQEDISFYLNGTEVARAPLPSSCDCEPGIVTVSVTDPALLALGHNGDNVFEMGTGGDIAWVAMEASGPWGELAYSLGDSSGGGDADIRNPDLCAAGSQIGATSGVAFGLWGGEECDDANADNDDACSNACTVNKCFGVSCTNPGECQTTGTCNPTTGACEYAAKPDGTACDDHSLCTAGDVCAAGSCVGASTVECPSAPSCAAPPACLPATGQCSAPAQCSVCGDGVVGFGEECDDGGTLAGDGCGPTCKNEYCGDGSVLRTLGRLRFIALGRSCDGGPADISFYLNGTEVARAPLPGSCDCQPGLVTVDITDPALLALGRNGDNVFEMGTAGDIAWVALEASGPWGGLAYPLGDSGGGGDADIRNPDICVAGSQIGATSGVAFWLWGGEECDDGNADNEDACSNACTINR